MTDFLFYHLHTSSLEAGLYQLLEKAWQSNFRVLVKVPTEERAEELCAVLWIMGRLSFLPHATKADGLTEHQPILLDVSDQENLNKADVLICLEGTQPSNPDYFRRCLFIFGEENEDLKQQLVRQYAELKDKNPSVFYWKQNPNGQWEKSSL